MTYHVARNNQQLGAFPKEDLLARYNRGEILPTDLVWTEGMPTWQPASQVFGAPIAPAGTDIPAPATPPPYAPPPVMIPPVPATGIATPISSNASRPPKPDNYLVWAILTTLLCCLPFGVVAIIFAAQVDGKYNSGDYEGAKDSSAKAKKFSLIALIAGVAVAVLYIAFIAIMAALGASQGRY